jgi:L-amino acid N-acyltransferase YncA
MLIQALLPAHYPAVQEIYEQGIATGHATFETKSPRWDDWDQAHLVQGRLVATDESGQVMGWAALTPVSGRCVYAGVAEVSVYVRQEARGKGVGKRLLEALIRESEKENIWTLQAGIFPENTASLKLHEQSSFRKIGYRERIGKMNNIWRDIVLLERRSATVGMSSDFSI